MCAGLMLVVDGMADTPGLAQWLSKVLSRSGTSAVHGNPEAMVVRTPVTTSEISHQKKRNPVSIYLFSFSIMVLSVHCRERCCRAVQPGLQTSTVADGSIKA